MLRITTKIATYCKPFFPGTHYKHYSKIVLISAWSMIKSASFDILMEFKLYGNLKYLMKTFSTYSQRHWLMEIGVPGGLHISMHVFIMKHFILAVIRAIKPFCDNIWYRKMQTPWRLPKSIFVYLIELRYSKCLHIWIYT